MSAAAEDSFWTFSVALYARPGVAPALIALQDGLGLDVNMILYCCWRGTEGGALTAADLAAVEAVAEPWQAEVVRPLRSLRRRLRGGFGALPPDRVEAYRKRLNELEIEAERIAQEAMVRVPPGGRGDSDSAAARIAANLGAYLQLRNVAADTAGQAHLEAVARACCPEADPGPLTFASV